MLRVSNRTIQAKVTEVKERITAANSHTKAEEELHTTTEVTAAAAMEVTAVLSVTTAAADIISHIIKVVPLVEDSKEGPEDL